MVKFGRLAIVAGILMLAPIGKAKAAVYAVVYNTSGGQINVSNNQYSMDPMSGKATWTWLDFTITAGSLGKSWHVSDMGIKCGTGWVVRAQSGSTGSYRDSCLQIPWGQVGCVGVVIGNTGLKMAQIPWQACSNTWWEQAGQPAFMQIMEVVTRIAEALA